MGAADQVVITSVGDWFKDLAGRHEDEADLPKQPAHPSKRPKPQAIGGAVAQCRFSGRTATPIFASPPLDGSPLQRTKQKSPVPPERTLLPVQGYTCDGLPSQDVPTSRWRFDLNAWRWEAAEGEGNHDGSAAALQHAIAARRWGDGRDHLASKLNARGKDPSSKPSVASSSALLVEPRGAHPPMVQRTLYKSKNVEVVAANAARRGFDAVGGLEAAKQALLLSIAYPLRHPTLYELLGVACARGVLLKGLPGSGKTLLARALAEEARCHLEAVDCAACVGSAEAEKRLRSAFAAARAAAPSILFLDDIDALAPNRTATTTSDVERQSTALALTLLDELRRSGDAVAVLAATSRAEALDGALRRPGRLDSEICLTAPNRKDRRDILRIATAAMPLEDDVDVDVLADRLHGYMGADVAGLAAEAALRCACEVVEALEEAAFDTSMVGPSMHQTSLVIDALNEPSLLATVRVAKRHFEEALRSMAPSVLRPVIAESLQDTIGWQDVGGLHAAKKELQEAVEWPLLHSERLVAAGLPVGAGVLLYGPPGCGKTMLAKAVASSCHCNFIAISGPELLQMWLGESERAVRDVFAAARAASPCVVFFDEIDAIAVARSRGSNAPSSSPSSSAGGDAAAARVLTQLLCEMDGLASKGGVLVVAATNRPAAIDAALLRPGRLDRMVKVSLPDARARAAILRRSLSRCPLAPGVDLDDVSEWEGMRGFSGADVAEVARRAGTALVRAFIAASCSDTHDDQAVHRDARFGKEPRDDFLRLKSTSCGCGVQGRGGGVRGEGNDLGGNETGLMVTNAMIMKAVESVPRSVSDAQVRYFDDIEARIRSGQGMVAAEEEEEETRRRAASMAREIKKVMEAAYSGKVISLQQRVEQLEAALVSAGLEVPALDGLEASSLPPLEEEDGPVEVV
jgi:transitional endoplasmic reticulum ATPase